jgi:hypothetical protein
VKVRVSVQPFYDYLHQQYQHYLIGGIDVIDLDFTHPAVDQLSPIKAMWKDI